MPSSLQSTRRMPKQEGTKRTTLSAKSILNCGKTSSNDTPAVCMRMMPLTPLLLGKIMSGSIDNRRTAPLETKHRNEGRRHVIQASKFIRYHSDTYYRQRQTAHLKKRPNPQTAGTDKKEAMKNIFHRLLYCRKTSFTPRTCPLPCRALCGCRGRPVRSTQRRAPKAS